MKAQLYRLFKLFRSRTILEQLAAIAFLVGFVIYGGTKSTNNVPSGASAPLGSAPMHMVQGSVSDEGMINGFAEEDFSRGFVLGRIGTNEVFDFSAPEGAIICDKWQRCGAAEDWFYYQHENQLTSSGSNSSISAVSDLPIFAGTNGISRLRIFSYGAIQALPRELNCWWKVLQTSIGIVPEANWRLLSETNRPSIFWTAQTDFASTIFTWQNVLLNRMAETPVSFQAEFYERRKFVYRYDLSRAGVDAVSNIVCAASLGNHITHHASLVADNNQCGQSSFWQDAYWKTNSLAANVTSLTFYRLTEEDRDKPDRDGDGLSTADEIFIYNTDPDLPDTDCDGVSDGEEVFLRRTNPLVADTDGDGLVDGSDPEPLVATSLLDADGDGIPDAYENYWFEGTNVVDSADFRDETGFMLRDKILSGMNPIDKSSYLEPIVTITNALEALKICDAFSMRRSQGVTNLICERTFQINRANAWQQFFISAHPSRAMGWKLKGVELEWETSAGSFGVVTGSRGDDSFRIPLSSDDEAQTITIRLWSVGEGVLSVREPLYLIGYAPVFKIPNASVITGMSGEKFIVFMRGAESEMKLEIDSFHRPSHAPVEEEERDMTLFGEFAESDAMCEFVGTEQDGVTNRTDASYAEISNEIWRIETTATIGSVTNALNIRKTQLSGFADNCRSRVIVCDGLSQSSSEATKTFDPATGIETETIISSSGETVTRKSKHGIEISSETKGTTTAQHYDAFARVVRTMRETEEDGIVSMQDFVYAPCGDLLEMRTYTNENAVIVTSYEYDALGNKIAETDAHGNSIHRTYNPSGQVISESGATYPTRFSYDTEGRRTKLLTTRDGTSWDETQWSYDLFTGNCVSKTYADGSVVNYSYTDDGLPLRTTYASGKWKENVYDEKAKLVGMSYSSNGIAYETLRDEFNRVISTSDQSDNSWQYAYAAGSILTNEIQSTGGRTNSLMRHHDSFNRATGYALSVDGMSKGGIGYGYDTGGRLAFITATNSAGRTFSVAYTNRGEFCHGYALTTQDGRKLRRVIERDKYRPSLVTACTTTFEGNMIADYRYQYDALGRVLTRNGDSFDYDARSQVTNAVIAAHHFAHEYDEIGNHVYAGADADINLITNNSLNQTTAFGDELITWNADGGMASDANWNYEYDAQDRLVSVTSRMLANGAIRVHNSYDYRNRRISKAIDRYDSLAGDWHLSECHEFVWDDLNIIHETISVITGSITNISEIQYFWGNDLSDTLQGAGGVGGLLAVSLNGEFYFPVYDNNGNVMKYVDELGDVVAMYMYDDFGALVSASGSFSDSFAFRFSTKYYDYETEFLAYQLRNFHPACKQWINRDPIEERGGENLYAFCKNNSLSNFDKDGCAYFALRRLENFIWIPGLSHNLLFDYLNIEIAHELVFLEDGKPRSNSGFSHDGVTTEETLGKTYYHTDGGYNDCVMRKAIDMVKFNGHDYSVFWGFPKIVKCNCQDYCSALRRKYSELMQDKNVRCECNINR